MQDITLLVAQGACSLAPHTLLRETDAKFTIELLNIRQGIPEKLRRVNPKLRVPVLEFHDGTALTELPAIMVAISQMSPAQHFMGRTNLESLRLYEWLNWLSSTLHAQGYGIFWRPQRFAQDATLHHDLKQRARDSIIACYEQIEAKLDGPFAVGGALTAVDPFLFVFYRWGNLIGLPMEAKYPKYTRHAREMSKRPSLQAALRAEGDYQVFWCKAIHSNTLAFTGLLPKEELPQDEYFPRAVGLGLRVEHL
ncbi:Glutathione S-transferase, domain-containing protein [Cladophialophora immunda]|nr:Glutathione S-transferase, domain-containing protein [Cladophialophora immunda]